MWGVEHTVSLFLNDVSKTPVLNQIIAANKSIKNWFVLAYITNIILYSNQKWYEFLNRNIGLFSVHDTSLSGYLNGM